MRSARARAAYRSMFVLTLAVTGAAQAEQPQAVQPVGEVTRREGRLIVTGGTLDFRDRDERRQVRQALPPPAVPRTTRQRDWLDDVADTLFGPNETPRRKPQHARRLSSKPADGEPLG